MIDKARVAELVESVHGLAVIVAKRRCKALSGIYDLEDMVQAALCGAARAAHTYDESQGKFSTYATHAMNQECFKLYRTSGVVRIPKREYEAMESLDRVQAMFQFTYTSAPVNTAGDSEILLESLLPDPDPVDPMMQKATVAMIHKLLGRLSESERRIVLGVYGFHGQTEETVAAVSAELGFTRQRGGQIFKRAMAKLTTWVHAYGLTPQWLEH